MGMGQEQLVVIEGTEIYGIEVNNFAGTLMMHRSLYAADAIYYMAGHNVTMRQRGSAA